MEHLSRNSTNVSLAYLCLNISGESFIFSRVGYEFFGNKLSSST